MIDINLNTIFYTHVEHSSPKTVYLKYNMEKQINKHTHTHAYSHTKTCLIEFKMVSAHMGEALAHSTTFLRSVPNVAFETAFLPVIKSALGHGGLVEVICFV